MRKSWLLPALILGVSLPALARAQPPVHVSNAWIRLLPVDLPLAGYLTLHNQSAETITLVGASSPAFRRIDMHRSMSMHGMEQMTSVAEIHVAAGQTFSFAPGGYHLMMWRNRALYKGEKVPVVLKLSNGVEIHATFTIESATHE